MTPLSPLIGFGGGDGTKVQLSVFVEMGVGSHGFEEIPDFVRYIKSEKR